MISDFYAQYISDLRGFWGKKSTENYLIWYNWYELIGTNKQCYNHKSRTCTFCIGVPFISFLCECKIGHESVLSRNNLLELFSPQSCESSMTSFTVANREAAFLPCGPIEGYEECLSVTGEGGWLKKKVGEKDQRLEEARADGRTMRRRSIVSADIAKTFHGFSRGDVTRNRQWRGKKLSNSSSPRRE